MSSSILSNSLFDKLQLSIKPSIEYWDTKFHISSSELISIFPDHPGQSWSPPFTLSSTTETQASPFSQILFVTVDPSFVLTLGNSISIGSVSVLL